MCQRVANSSRPLTVFCWLSFTRFALFVGVALISVDGRAATDVTFTPLASMRAVADGVFVHDGAAIAISRAGLTLRAFESECRAHGSFHAVNDERALCVIHKEGQSGRVWLVSATRIVPGDTDTVTVTMSTSAGDDARAAMVGGVVRAMLDRCFRYTVATEERGRLVVGEPVSDCVEPTASAQDHTPPIPSAHVGLRSASR
jgi:hypothetical protein